MTTNGKGKKEDGEKRKGSSKRGGREMENGMGLGFWSFERKSRERKEESEIHEGGA